MSKNIPGAVRRQKGSSRQAIWDSLLEKAWPNAGEMAKTLGINQTSCRAYVSALIERGYVKRHADGTIELVRNTGPLAPSWSLDFEAFRDWNLNPPMSAVALAEVIHDSGHTLRKWLVAHGMSAEGQTRLREMIEGRRPVSPHIEIAARNELLKKQGCRNCKTCGQPALPYGRFKKPFYCADCRKRKITETIMRWRATEKGKSRHRFYSKRGQALRRAAETPEMREERLKKAREQWREQRAMTGDGKGNNDGHQ